MKSLSKLLSILSCLAVCYSWPAQAIFIVDIPLDEQEITEELSLDTLRQQVNISESKQISALYDLTTIFNSNNVYNVNLSPDGLWLSYFEKSGEEHKRIVSLWLYNVKDKTTRKLFSAKKLSNAMWAQNSQSLFLDSGSNIAVISLTKNSAPQILVKKNKRQHDRILSTDDIYMDSIITRIWDKKSKQFQVIRINDKGVQTVIYQTPTRFAQFGLDEQSVPSIITRHNEKPDNKGEKYIIDIANNQEKVLWTCQWDDTCRAIHYDRQRHQLLIGTNYQSDLSRIVLIDLKTNTLKVVHQDPIKRADYENAILQYNKKQLSTAIVSYHGDYLKNYALDASVQTHINGIEHQLESPSISLYAPFSQNIKQQTWLVTDLNNAYSTLRYYLYQPATKSLTRPLKTIIERANKDRKMINPKDFSLKFPVQYRSRDGFLLQGYVSLPSGVNIKSAPLVTNVHGGPWSRVTAKYQRSTQLLTNRGYIVFEPNFRSSTGFGKTYLTSTKGEHGDGRIQRDIIDGVDYLIANDIGDKDRLAIVGHSFGAYSTLAGLAYTPDLFQVGFAGAPPHDIGRSAKYYYRFTKKTNKPLREYFFKQLVVDWDNKPLMAQHYKKSPAAHANKISKPLVMWAGKNDRRVFIADVKNYALTIEDMGKSVSLFIDPNAMHSPTSRLGLFAYQYLLEKTLADHIGGKLKAIDPAKDKKLWRFLNKNMALDHNNLLK
jgi:dipeptidyl aminopeptidase/acylaminoacyl peptidase